MSDFANNKTKPDGKHNMCKQCKKEYNKLYYAKTKDIHNPSRYERRKKEKDDIGSYIKEYKESRPCADCGNFYPSYVMDFDHQRDKSFTIGNRQYIMNQVKAEIEKCEVVCSNCHRERTHGSKALK